MPKPGKITKTILLIIFFVFAGFFGIYLLAKKEISEDGLITMITSAGGSAIMLIIMFYQSWIKKDSNETKLVISEVQDDIVELKNNDAHLDKKITGLNARYMSLEEQNAVYNDALKDIKIGLAEKDERSFYIYEMIKHKDDILSLCNRIKASTSNLIEEKYNLHADVESFINGKVNKFCDIITVLYQSKFDDFKPKYFLRTLLNNLDLSLSNSNLIQEVKNEIQKEMGRRIEEYVIQVNIILENNDNGERRKRFVDYTFEFQNNSTSFMLDVYTQLNKQIA